MRTLQDGFGFGRMNEDARFVPEPVVRAKAREMSGFRYEN